MQKRHIRILQLAAQEASLTPRRNIEQTDTNYLKVEVNGHKVQELLLGWVNRLLWALERNIRSEAHI